MKLRIVVFASGNGSNAQNIIEHFLQGELARVVMVLTNKKDAKVIDRAKNFNVNTLCFDKVELSDPDRVLRVLKELRPHLIVLAGFLLKFPKIIIDEFPNSIINIHPALLPKFGGKGMYGDHVHKAVIEAQEKETGITIHYVNEFYDEGAIIFQQKVALGDVETIESVRDKIRDLEMRYFPLVIEDLLLSTEKMQNG